MLRIFAKSTLFAAALLTSFTLLGSISLAQEACPPGSAGAGSHLGLKHHALNCRNLQYGSPELFYNYYVPGTCGGVPAQMYLAPRPVPPMVGHTYYTYQPFMPHELLYQHHRRYYRYYDGGRGFTRTHISWYRPPLRNGLDSVYNHFRIAR